VGAAAADAVEIVGTAETAAIAAIAGSNFIFFQLRLGPPPAAHPSLRVRKCM
jgi:hypothetical protein